MAQRPDNPDTTVTSMQMMIRVAHRYSGMTTADLAKKAGIGLSTLRAYKNGHRQPALPIFNHIIKAAGFQLVIRIEPLDKKKQRVPALEMRPDGDFGD